MLGLWLAPAMAWAHGDVHDRIEAMNRRIRERPGDAALYLRRGSLHGVHEDWSRAVADYETAQRLDPALPRIGFYLGKALLRAGRPERALESLEVYLRAPASPGAADADAYVVQARALVALERPADAVRSYSAAIERFSRPAPTHYLERARAAMAAGKPDQAIAGLEEGAARLGPLVTFAELAVDIETGRHAPERALAWIARLPPAARHAPRWRSLAGQRLLEAGRAPEALTEFQAGLHQLEALPPSRRLAPAVQAMRAELEVLVRDTESMLSRARRAPDAAADSPGATPRTTPQGLLPVLLWLLCGLAVGWLAARFSRRGGVSA